MFETVSAPKFETFDLANEQLVGQLESVMRNVKFSHSRFLTDDEGLRDRILTDKEVVDSLDLTNEQISAPLFECVSKAMAGESTLQHNGHSYTLELRGYIGFAQSSPFGDGTSAGKDIIVTRDDGKSILLSPLLPEMISRYGFYEGKSLPYRLDPLDIIEFFNLVSHSTIIQRRTSYVPRQ